MPCYRNPNPHPVSVTLLEPRTSLKVFPWRWPASRVPEGGAQSVELSAELARVMVSTGMLEACPGEPPVQAQPAPPAAPPVPEPEPEPVDVVTPTPEQLATAAAPIPDPAREDTVRIEAPSRKSQRRRFYVPEEG